MRSYDPQYLRRQKEISFPNGTNGECIMILVLFEASLWATSLDAFCYILMVNTVTWVAVKILFTSYMVIFLHTHNFVQC